MSYLVGVIPTNEIDNYHNAFDAFDDNSDGKINKEFLEPLLRSLGYNPFPAEVEDMLLDLGSDNTFDFDSFMVIVSRHSRSVDPEKELLDIFKSLDKERTGRLEVSFVKNILENIKNPLTKEQIENLFEDLRVDEDGTIDYEVLVDKMLGF